MLNQPAIDQTIDLPSRLRDIRRTALRIYGPNYETTVGRDAELMLSIERNGGPNPLEQAEAALEQSDDGAANFRTIAAASEAIHRRNRPTTEPRPQGCGPEGRPREGARP